MFIDILVKSLDVTTVQYDALSNLLSHELWYDRENHREDLRLVQNVYAFNAHGETIEHDVAVILEHSWFQGFRLRQAESAEISDEYDSVYLCFFIF